MPKITNTVRDRKTGRMKSDNEHARRESSDESAPPASKQEHAAETTVSPADGVLDPSLNESSRH